MENNHKKKKLFQIEKEVLYHNITKKKYYNSKLEEKWKGSYIINTILLNGSYKIVNQYEVLCIPINGNCLKRYD